VSELRVETEHVFSRHAAAEMSVAYGILVPQARERIVGAATQSLVLDPGTPRRSGSALRGFLRRWVGPAIVCDTPGGAA
jgi:hypothetical protein